MGRIILACLVLVVGVLMAAPAEAMDRPDPRAIAKAPTTTLRSSLQRAAVDRSLPKVDPSFGTRTQTRWQICDPCKRSKKWELILGPYGWLAGVHGTAWAEGQGEYFEIDFDQLKEITSGGFMWYTEFRYDRWFIAFDGTWATLEEDFSFRVGSAGFQVKQKILELRGGMRVLGPRFGTPCDCHCSPCPPKFKDRFALDAYLGVRYWENDTTLRIGVGPLAFEGKSKQDWIDPLIGLRFGYRIAPRWSLNYRIDVGGFDIDDGSKFAYHSQLIASWHFARRFSLVFGYRAMGTDRVIDTPFGRSGTDIHQNGPMIGLLFKL